MKKLIAYLYKKYCRTYWHDEMWEIVLRAVKAGRSNAYHDICSRVPIEKVKEMVIEAEHSGEKYFTLAKLMEESINPKTPQIKN